MKAFIIIGSKKRIIDLRNSISYFNLLSKNKDYKIIEYININNYSNEELGKKVIDFIRG